MLISQGCIPKVFEFDYITRKIKGSGAVINGTEFTLPPNVFLPF